MSIVPFLPWASLPWNPCRQPSRTEGPSWPGLQIPAARPPDTEGSRAPLAMDPAPYVERLRGRRTVRWHPVCGQGGQPDTAERPLWVMRFLHSARGAMARRGDLLARLNDPALRSVVCA